MNENNNINWLGNKVMESGPQKMQPNMRDRTYIPAAPPPAAAQNMAAPMPNAQVSPAAKPMTSPVQTKPAQKNMVSPEEMNTKMPDMDMDMDMDTDMDVMPYRVGRMPAQTGSGMPSMEQGMPSRMESEMPPHMEHEMPSRMERSMPRMERGMPGQTMQGTGTMQQGVPPTLRPGTFEEGPPPVMNKMYVPGYLESLMGKLVRAEFFIGNQTTDRAGRIVDVGVNYFVLEDMLTGNLIMCDLYSVKFVTVAR
jgi:hypothetical protein